MSCGLRGPSISGSPARMGSPSWTLTCTPRGISYSRDSAWESGTMSTLRRPLTMPPNFTTPSISLMIAGSRGLRASNSSTTRGRPPVMSLVFVVSRGILASTSPAMTSSPSSHHEVGARRHVEAPRGAVLLLDLHRRLLLLVRRVDDDLPREAGDLVDFLVDRQAFEDVLEPHEARRRR